MLTLLALVIALWPASSQAAPATVSVYDSLAVLRPDAAPPAGSSSRVVISAAQNEAESFQVLVRAGSAQSGLRVLPGAPLTGPGGATLPADAMTIYREGYYSVNRRSDAEGATGSWPDVLIPAVDPIYGQDRSAFPINLDGGAQLAAWVDIYVPQGQAPGTYEGSIIVNSNSGHIDSVPVSITVQGFSLPSTSSLRSAFFTEAGLICEAFTGDDNCRGNAEKAWQLEALFAETGLNNRMTIANPVPSTPTGELFERFVVPLINGTDSRVRLRGAKLTSIEAYGPTCAVPGSSCLSQWRSAAQRHNFESRFFLYNCDEPAAFGGWDECRQNATVADNQWPGVKKLITATNEDVLRHAPYTDIVAPVVNYDDGSPIGGGREKWLYTSCMSFSCDASEDPAWDGWPGYAIDQPASQARAMGWVAFESDATGELYWNTTVSLPTAKTNQYVSGGNGDGNLFYAGTPNGAHGSVDVGGSTDIPLESIRLKRFRDGREDYEYMELLRARGKASNAKAVIRGLFGSQGKLAGHTTVGHAALDSARAELTRMLGGTTATTTKGPKKPLRVTLLRIRVPRSANALRRRGVRALVRCTVACRVDLGTKVTHRAAKRIGVRNTKIGKGTKRIGAGNKRWVTARLTRHARTKLRREGIAKIAVRPQLRSKRV